MSRLVVLSEGLTGRAYDLKVDKTTIGRVEDNSFQIPEGSVSSHHCEILLRGSEIVVKDLNSTNGSFVNGQQFTGEAVLKPGQILRLGQIEMRLESGEAAATGKKLPDQTMFIPQGVKLGSDTGTKPVHFGGSSPFEKKNNTGTKTFIIIAVVTAVVIFGIIAYFLLVQSKDMKPKPTGENQLFNQRATSAAA
ncbi:MAG: FHA domain-containing protein [Verrucomicrobiota bacterium]